MKVSICVLIVFIAGAVIFDSCKPKPNNTITGGGKGGTATIYIAGEHHGSLLDTCIAYIKFGTLDAPANGVYDDSDSVKLSNGVPIAHFDSLTVGIYYVLVIGYHGAYSPPNVKGGYPLTIYNTGSVVSDTVPTYQYNP